jgi:hypothetical protein
VPFLYGLRRRFVDAAAAGDDGGDGGGDDGDARLFWALLLLSFALRAVHQVG